MSGGFGRGALTAVAAVALLTLAGCGEGADRGAGDGSGAGGNAYGGGGGGGGGGAAGGGAASACLAAVEYDGRLYVQVPAETPDQGAELDGAVVPGCDDMAGEQPAPDQPIAAYTITGVDAEFAIAAGDGEPMVYVSEDYAPGMVDAKPLPDDVAAELGIPAS